VIYDKACLACSGELPGSRRLWSAVIADAGIRAERDAGYDVAACDAGPRANENHRDARGTVGRGERG